MVKFGKYNLAIRERLARHKTYYVVDYNSLKQLATKPQVEFCKEWSNVLQMHSSWLQKVIKDTWAKIFGVIALDENARGATPRLALKIFIKLTQEKHKAWVEKQGEGDDARKIERLLAPSSPLSPKSASEAEENFASSPSSLLRRFKYLELVCECNTESLRKAVKKFDKNAKIDRPLTAELLPGLYAVAMATPNFKSYSNILVAGLSKQTRDPKKSSPAFSVVFGESVDLSTGSKGNIAPMSSIVPNSAPPRFNTPDLLAMQNQMAGRKRSELEWLGRTIEGLPEDFRKRLVLHRGFHAVDDNNDRPLENSLAAYELAWSAGAKFCECDISLTLDGYIVLCHDENFKRVALFGEDNKSSRLVSELTFRELIALPLKSGQRPPLLADVLTSANNIGNGSQLVVEIKPGNANVADALYKLFTTCPSLVENVGVVMSFDLFCIHQFNRKYRTLQGSTGIEEVRDSDFKIMLLTVSDPQEPAPYLHVSLIGGMKIIEEWLAHTDSGSSLDGVYLQYDPAMRTEEGVEALNQLVDKYTVGVWGVEPDQKSLAEFLMSKGVTFVNTDMPHSFLQ